MAHAELQALVSDVDRLLVAGGTVAPGDEGLRRRARALRELGQKVPVLAQVADAVERVTGATPAKASQALLDLLVVVRQLRAGLTTAGVDGATEPIPPSGPWTTNTAAHDLYPIVEVLAARSGSGRLDNLKQAQERNVLTDLRLVEPLLAALDDRYGELADVVAEDVLPAFGPPVLPDLRQGLNVHGKSSDARRLAAICRIDRRAGAELCRTALADGSPALRRQARECLKG
jgi:hypothetical protein